ncbi:MAG: family 78 glycoside hydrolase catalytic domain [Candidatus Zhuqueibacterota bacterium]
MMMKCSPQYLFFLFQIAALGIIFLAVLNSAALANPASRPAISNVRTEYKINPIGVDVRLPRLNWEITSSARGVKQTAYQIVAAANSDDLKQGKNLLWDSGKTASDQSIHVVYQGPALQSGQRIYWQVRIWDERDRVSDWSNMAFWEMGLLDPSDWRASWIHPAIEEDATKAQPCPFLRKEFELAKPVKSARAYVSALGLYEMRVNGKRVGDEVLTPGWTSYNKRLQYQSYDISGLLKPGRNAIGAILGDGWYRGFSSWDMKRNFYGDSLALLLQIKVTFQDGTSEMIVTDGSWKSATGPILESDIYNGEVYDARLEKPGWSNIGFDDSDWNPVTFPDHSKDMLVASYGPPVRRIQEIKPISLLKTPSGETVVDMGQNMVGWIRLKVKGPAGTTVKLKHAEVLDKEGNLYTENLRKAKQRIEYTLKGDTEEIYEPHFTFMGFRYVAVEGYPGELDLTSLTGVVVHSDMTPAGNFQCSNPMINQLQHNIQWGQKGNFVDVPTDCPQRDERMGWTGDAQVFAPTACFNYDAASFYTKWLRDVAADQFENGSVPHVIPDVLKSGGSAAWADAAVIVPWTVYLQYGDRRILEQQYASMKAWVDYMKSQAGESCLWKSGGHFGDWLAFATNRSDYPGATTEKDLIANAYFARSTHIVQRTAALLDRTEDAEYYARLAEKVKQAFQQEYITPNGRIVSNTQTAFSLALEFDLYPESLKQRAARFLADDVEKFKHITTGFVGSPLLCDALRDNGYIDLVYMLLNRTDYPSWLYPITKGATTIWERWDGIKPDGSFQDAGMNSFNHYAYGAIGDWMYREIAGIQIDPSAPGYKHCIFQPRPGGNLTSASAEHHSMYGKIQSAWKIDGINFALTISIPPNTSGTVMLPNARLDLVTENGKRLSDVDGITNFSEAQNAVRVELGSGNYLFQYQWKNTN